METTNGAFARDVQRITREFSLSPAEQRRRDAILRIAYANIVSHFDCRPHPRAAWDRNADGTEARWNRVLSPIRMAVAAAVATGDQNRVDRTLEAARGFFREMEADITSLVPPREEASIVAVALDETHVEGPANESQALLIANPSPTNAERAILPLERQHERLGALIEHCRRRARENPQMVSVR